MCMKKKHIYDLIFSEILLLLIYDIVKKFDSIWIPELFFIIPQLS